MAGGHTISLKRTNSVIGNTNRRSTSTVVYSYLFVTQPATKETSDFKEGFFLARDVWKSAMKMSGGQCVMTSGETLMLL